MKIFKQYDILDGNYTMRGKTRLVVSNGNYNGWYVGYLEKGDNACFFATNISAKDKFNKTFNKKRKSITINALKQLDFIN